MADRARTFCAAALLAALAAACSTKAAAEGAPSSEGASGAVDKSAVATPGEVQSCGPGKAECPMQRWMKANLQAFQRSHDNARLAAAFEQLAEVEPSGYEGWAASARQGAEAAARGDDAGVSRSCETCHRQHRDTFRRTLRTKQLL